MTRPFSELSDTLAGVQEQSARSSALLLQRGSPFMQKLETWLYSLPAELSLPIIPGTQHLDLSRMNGILSAASNARKAELVRTQFQDFL